MQLVRDIRYLWPRAPSKVRKYLYLLRMACLGIDLRGVDLRTRSPQRLIFSSLVPSTAGWHESSGGSVLEMVLNTLSISCNDSILDIGCGKGGAMITMAQYPFAHIDGVEISSDLAEIARRNLARLRMSRSSITCCNAADFTDLDCYTFLYMYNPFYRDILEPVLGNVRLSLERHPRRLTLIYANPRYEDLLIQTGFREIRTLHHPLYPTVVYVAQPDTPSILLQKGLSFQ